MPLRFDDFFTFFQFSSKTRLKLWNKLMIFIYVLPLFIQIGPVIVRLVSVSIEGYLGHLLKALCERTYLTVKGQ